MNISLLYLFVRLFWEGGRRGEERKDGWRKDVRLLSWCHAVGMA